MGIETVTAFVDAVRQSRLLEADLLEKLSQRAPERFADPRTLARHLIEKGRLTAYQVNQLFQGQGNTLVLGNYVLLERLGEGGMGQVFKARHRSMGRIVALKVIRRDRLENADAVKRFRREIQAVAQLSHANVVVAFDADAVGNTHFFVMEYVDGIDLSQLVKQKGPLPVGMACDYIRQAALGLDHAHQKGIVHRDIKPSNLLVTHTHGSQSVGLVKILDMGLARLAPQEVEDTSGGSLSQDGAVIGTPDFMSPEQAKNSSKVDSRADIYSLGCTLHYLLTGQSPFVGGTSIEKLMKHQMDEPLAVEQFRSDVPEPVSRLLQRMLAKRPEYRVQTAAEVAAALTPFAGGRLADLAASNGAGLNVPFAGSGTTATMRIADTATPAAHSQFRLVRRHWRGLAVAGGGLLFMIMGWLMVKALFGTSADGKPQSSGGVTAAMNFTPRQSASGKSVPAEPTHKYLSDDTGAALVVDLPQLLNSAALAGPVRNRLEVSLNNMKASLGLMGVELFQEVQRVIIASSPAVPVDKTCMVFYGQFRPERIEAVCKKFKSRDLKGIPDAHVYETHDQAANRTYYFGLVNPRVFVSCTDLDHLTNCFRRSAGSRVPNLSDEPVQKLLQNLEGRPTIYVVIGRSALTREAMRAPRDMPVLSIHGGLRFHEDLRAEMTFTADTPDRAENLGHFSRMLLANLLMQVESIAPLVPTLVHEKPVINPKDGTVTFRHSYSAGEIRKLMLEKKP